MGLSLYWNVLYELPTYFINGNEWWGRYDVGETKPVKPLEYQIVDTLPTIKKDSALVVGVYDTNYHKSPILGFGIYNDQEAYYISLEKAIQDQGFKQFIEDENIKKYGYDIKKCINACRWHGLTIKGYSFDLQLASYILNPSLKDELKIVCDYYQYFDLQFDEEIFGKGAKKHVPEESILSKHYVLQAKAIYELKDEAIKVQISMKEVMQKNS